MSGCALYHEGGREVFELLSDSEPEADDGDSDLEALEALQRTSRSSSAIPLPDPEQFLGHNSDSAEPDARRLVTSLPTSSKKMRQALCHTDWYNSGQIIHARDEFEYFDGFRSGFKSAV
ncbi:hypothetical protein DFH09DRAFT_1303914 [Mycena vulgaris]|nr:hypothetical protein DFH09DRAFT_1303914 [Mycena vulgaris]